MNWGALRAGFATLLCAACATTPSVLEVSSRQDDGAPLSGRSALLLDPLLLRGALRQPWMEYPPVAAETIRSTIQEAIRSRLAADGFEVSTSTGLRTDARSGWRGRLQELTRDKVYFAASKRGPPIAAALAPFDADVVILPVLLTEPRHPLPSQTYLAVFVHRRGATDLAWTRVAFFYSRPLDAGAIDVGLIGDTRPAQRILEQALELILDELPLAGPEHE